MEIFKYNSVANQFVEEALVGLKKKFLQEGSRIKRSAIVFLLSKIYFTDDMANTLKLRITVEEWSSFKDFMWEIKPLPEFDCIRIMLFHLFTENCFRFTMKNKSLALDYGAPDDGNETCADPNQNAQFWLDVEREIEILQRTDVVELTQLNALREEAIKPFQEMFPERGLLSEALNNFDVIKSCVASAPAPAAAPAKVSRKEVNQACKEFLKASGAGSYVRQIEIDEIDSDSFYEPPERSQTSKKGRKKKEAAGTQKVKVEPDDSDSSDYDGDRDFSRHHQSFLKGAAAAGNFTDKLKRCYGKFE